MAFKTDEELLRFFQDGGSMLNVKTGELYDSDINGDGCFYGVVYAWVPEDRRTDIADAVECALGENNGGKLYEIPGCFFDELCEEYLGNKGDFIVERWKA